MHLHTFFFGWVNVITSGVRNKVTPTYSLTKEYHVYNDFIHLFSWSGRSENVFRKVTGFYQSRFNFETMWAS